MKKKKLKRYLKDYKRYSQLLEEQLLTKTMPLESKEEFEKMKEDWIQFKIPMSNMIVFYARRIKALEAQLDALRT